MKNDHSIFFCYAREDKRRVKKIYNDFVSLGYNVWMDGFSLPPGIQWEQRISEAIESSRIFIFFISKKSYKRIGYLRVELNEALMKQREFPPDDIFIIPVRLDNCEIPIEVRKFQVADYFKKQGRSMIRAVLRDKIGPGLPTPLREFWSPVIENGCTIIIGSQTTRLENGEIRPVTGKFDNIALSTLTNFLSGILRPSNKSVSKIKVEHMTMPRSIDKEKHDVRRSMRYYEETLSNLIKLKENIISLGMPCVNPASEILLSKVYEIEAFSPLKNPKMNRGFIINDKRKEIKSSLYVDRRDRKRGILNCKAESTPCRYKSKDLSCGIILKYIDKGSSVIVISGYNGMATIGGVKILSEQELDVDFINKNQDNPGYEDGFLYEVEYKSIENKNREYDGEIIFASILKNYP